LVVHVLTVVARSKNFILEQYFSKEFRLNIGTDTFQLLFCIHETFILNASVCY